MAEAWRARVEAERAEAEAEARRWKVRWQEARPLPAELPEVIAQLERQLTETLAALGAARRVQASATQSGRRMYGEDVAALEAMRSASRRAASAAQEAAEGPPPDLFEKGQLSRAQRL